MTSAPAIVLNTGANVSVINRAQAGQFGLSEEGSGVGSFGGVMAKRAPESARQVAISEFQIGSMNVRRSRVVTADLGQLLTALGRVTGEDVASIIG
jgi:hypothetical protein